MTLIKSSECGKTGSDKVQISTDCGNSAKNEITQTSAIIEKTSHWKPFQLIAGSLIVISLVGLALAYFSNNFAVVGYDIFILFIGLAGIAIGKFVTWRKRR